MPSMWYSSVQQYWIDAVNERNTVRQLRQYRKRKSCHRYFAVIRSVSRGLKTSSRDACPPNNKNPSSTINRQTSWDRPPTAPRKAINATTSLPMTKDQGENAESFMKPYAVSFSLPNRIEKMSKNRVKSNEGHQTKCSGAAHMIQVSIVKCYGEA